MELFRNKPSVIFVINYDRSTVVSGCNWCNWPIGASHLVRSFSVSYTSEKICETNFPEGLENHQQRYH